LALKVSGAVQAARWTALGPGQGYIYSFNGPHSLSSIRCARFGRWRSLINSGMFLMGERDRKISLLERLIEHGGATARYSIYYGEGRDAFDTRGRTVHETVFNLNDGSYRCPNSQQGYSPFSTWTRGLAWAILGFAEQLEFFEVVADKTERKAISSAQSLSFVQLWLPPIFISRTVARMEFRCGTPALQICTGWTITCQKIPIL